MNVFERTISRRTVVAALAATAAAGPSALLARKQEFHGELDLSDPADCLTAMIKMRGSLIAEDVPHWYRGTIYGVLPGKAPIPMVDFEGSEIDFYERQPDGSFFAYGATVSFFRDTRTDKLLEYYDNPITGKRVEVRPNTINVKAHYIYATNGFKRSDDPEPLGDEPRIMDYLKWARSGDQVWLEMRRPYPEGLPMGEHQLVRGDWNELMNPALPRVAATGAPTYISPWLGWMDMAGHEGHTVWAGPAHKVRTIEDYPRRLLDLVEKYHPEKLTADPDRTGMRT